MTEHSIKYLGNFLVLCEIYCVHIHGDASASLNTQYLVTYRFNSNNYAITFMDDYDEYDTDIDTDCSSDSDSDSNSDNNIILGSKLIKSIPKLEELLTIEKAHYTEVLKSAIEHPYIRNYKSIISRPNYIKPEIAQCYELPTLERVAILKTIWIRIIQRKWKNLMKQKSIFFRPSIKGMLSTLSKNINL
jgi:hypothetical protein